MGNCSGQPKTQPLDGEENDCRDYWAADDGSTSSTRGSGEDGSLSPGQSSTDLNDETQHTNGNKKVRFHPDTHENNVLREIFSEESLLEKRRKSFSADLRMFAVIFEKSGKSNTDEKNSK